MLQGERRPVDHDAIVFSDNEIQSHLKRFCTASHVVCCVYIQGLHEAMDTGTAKVDIWTERRVTATTVRR